MKDFSLRHPALHEEVVKAIAGSLACLAAAGIILPQPRLSYRLRGRSAGQARFAEHEIRLNAAMLAEHGTPFIAETVPHEMAHLAVHLRYGRKARPHGREWRAIMALLGVAPRRCHDWPVRPAGRTYTYACGCVTLEFSARRHALARRRAYWCRACGRRLIQATVGQQG